MPNTLLLAGFVISVPVRDPAVVAQASHPA